MQRLERSGGNKPSSDWLVEREEPGGKVAFLRARLRANTFSLHRHDTYTISVTEQGVQEFTYRGEVHRSLPGQVVILHPDETHDGRPATAEGLTFRSAYIEPDCVSEALRELTGQGLPLPFARLPVVADPSLAQSIWYASTDALDPLERMDLLREVCAGLLRHSAPVRRSARRRGLSDTQFAAVRDFLDAHFDRSVGANELEVTCGESRFNIAEEFRRRQGTSPHRYLLMRRLEFVRSRLATGSPLAELALEAGFADQAHMTRKFKAAFGLTPAVYTRLATASRL